MRDGPAREGGRDEDEGKGPGSAFGPESVPLATGLVSVVYWVPGPFPGPTPPSSRMVAYGRRRLLAQFARGSIPFARGEEK